MKKENVRKHCNILTAGCIATLIGATVLLFGIVGGTFFVDITRASGYTAVLLFIAGLMLLGGAFLLLYFTGLWIMRKGAFSK